MSPITRPMAASSFSAGMITAMRAPCGLKGCGECAISLLLFGLRQTPGALQPGKGVPRQRAAAAGLQHGQVREQQPQVRRVIDVIPRGRTADEATLLVQIVTGL